MGIITKNYKKGKEEVNKKKSLLLSSLSFPYLFPIST